MGYNILIVDDSATVQAVLEKTLKIAKVPVNELSKASNGKEALVELGKKWFDIVITDLNMPIMDGFALVAEMKKDEMLKTIPIIVVTTEGSIKRIEELEERGINGYVRKPFTPEQIKEVVDKVMEVQSGD